MRRTLSLSVLTVVIWAGPAFAVCEREQGELNDANVACAAASGASGAACILGSIFLGPFGGLLGLLPAPAAAAACGVRDEKDRALRSCIANAEAAEQQARAAAEEAERRAAAALAIQTRFVNAALEAQRRADENLERVIQDLVVSGASLTDESVRAHLDEVRDNTARELAAELATLELTRDAELAEVP